MNTALKAGIIGLTGLLAVVVLQKKAWADALQFAIQKIAFSTDAMGLILTLFVTARNTGQNTVRINSIKGKLYFNGQEAGDLDNDLQIISDAQKQVTIPVSIRLYYSAISDAILNFVNGSSSRKMAFEFKGTVTLDGIPFPVTLNHNIA